MTTATDVGRMAQAMGKRAIGRIFRTHVHKSTCTLGCTPVGEAMQIIIEVDDTTAAQLRTVGPTVHVPDFARRALAAHMRACQDATAVLRAMGPAPGTANATAAERWALELRDREPMVAALLAKGVADASR